MLCSHNILHFTSLLRGGSFFNSSRNWSYSRCWSHRCTARIANHWMVYWSTSKSFSWRFYFWCLSWNILSGWIYCFSVFSFDCVYFCIQCKYWETLAMTGRRWFSPTPRSFPSSPFKSSVIGHQWWPKADDWWNDRWPMTDDRDDDDWWLTTFEWWQIDDF